MRRSLPSTDVSLAGGADTEELTAVTLPSERAGLLTQASVLTLLSRTDNTSVVARGLFVRGALLCLPKIAGSAREPRRRRSGAARGRHDRARARGRTRNDAARAAAAMPGSTPSACCSRSYDPLGRHRDEIDGVADRQQHVARGPRQLHGHVRGRGELRAGRSGRAGVHRCLTRNLIAYGTGDDALETGHCQVGDAVTQLPASPTMRDLVRVATASPALIYRTVEVAP